MKVGLYDIINNPLPELYKIKDSNFKDKSLEYDEYIVQELNKNLMLDKLISEHVYLLSLTYSNNPKGIIQLSIGKCDESIISLRDLGIGLLLTGAEQFMCFHNHPGGNREISQSDILLTDRFIEVGNLLGIEFIRHIMITQNYYCECKKSNRLNDIPFS